MLNKVLTTLVSLIALIALLGCDEATPPDDGGTAAPATSPTEQPTPVTGDKTATPTAAETGQADTPAESADDGLEIPPDLIDEPWQAGMITLGLSVEEARLRLPVHESIPLQETWVVENYTGIMTAGTYADPIRRVLTVICYEGEVVGVNDSKRETESAFFDHFNHLVATLGTNRRDTPEFAEGRQFIYKMVHADPAPDYQYMWADEDKQYMYFAARFAEPSISNFALINAALYDDAASAMEAANPGGQ